MTKLHKWLIVTLISLFSVSLISCSDDDKKDEPIPERENTDTVSSVETELMKHRWGIRYEDWWGNLNHDINLESWYFLGNGKGVLDGQQRRESPDGIDRSSYTEYFTYKVTGNSVQIESDLKRTFTFTGSTLKGGGDFELKAEELSPEDLVRIERAKYEVMDDDERFNFSIGFINEEDYIEKCEVSDYEYQSYLTFGVSIKESEHVSSRKISMIKCKLSLEGGEFVYLRKPEVCLHISEDKDQCEIIRATIYRNVNATLVIDVYNFDDKIQKEVYINTFEFNFTNNPDFGGESGSDTGSDGSDSGGDNDSGESGENENDNPDCHGYLNGHSWVNLGLPSGTKWATMNIGATSETQIGDYFMWGCTEPSWAFSVYQHPLYDTTNGNWIRYLRTDYSRLLPEDDAAIQNWGNSWVMPTAEQCKELVKYCTFEYAANKSYCKVIGPNRQTMLIPLGGHSKDSFLNQQFFLWSNELGKEKNCEYAYAIKGYRYGATQVEGSLRSLGFNIRPVVK